VCIDLSGVDAGVSEHFLNHPDIRAALQQVSRGQGGKFADLAAHPPHTPTPTRAAEIMPFSKRCQIAKVFFHRLTHFPRPNAPLAWHIAHP